MDDWETVSLAVGGSSDMMVVNFSQLNATSNLNLAMSSSPSPIQSPGPYGVGQATSFVSSLIRGFTGASSPTNTSATIQEPFTSPKK